MLPATASDMANAMIAEALDGTAAEATALNDWLRRGLVLTLIPSRLSPSAIGSDPVAFLDPQLARGPRNTVVPAAAAAATNKGRELVDRQRHQIRITATRRQARRPHAQGPRPALCQARARSNSNIVAPICRRISMTPVRVGLMPTPGNEHIAVLGKQAASMKRWPTTGRPALSRPFPEAAGRPRRNAVLSRCRRQRPSFATFAPCDRESPPVR